MENPTPSQLFAQRWHALLAERTAIENEHLALLSSFTKSSANQTMQLNASAARLQKLNLKRRDLVDDWSADTRLK
jgi:hypothetical protein